jgi:hypothetical protein
MPGAESTGRPVTERIRRSLQLHWVPVIDPDGHVRLEMSWSPAPAPAPVGDGVTLAA